MMPFMGGKYTELDIMRAYGLFLAPLNNGDWIAGKANVIYDLDISSDHYQDERLSVASTPREALEKAAEKIAKTKGGR